MAVATVPLAHVPTDIRVYAALYTDVRNAKYLRDQLLAGNADFEYAFVEARMVLSTAHILAAVFRAVNDATQQRLKTRNVHSEVVFAMNPTNNIAEAFRRFGISEGSRELLVVKICSDKSTEAVAEHLRGSVDGSLTAFNDENIAALSDISAIRKVYKLNTPPAKGKQTTSGKEQLKGEVALDRQEIEMTVLGVLALRGAT